MPFEALHDNTSASIAVPAPPLRRDLEQLSLGPLGKEFTTSLVLYFRLLTIS